MQSLLQRGVGSPSKEEQGAAVVEEEISDILVGETVCVYLVGVCVCLCGPWMGCVLCATLQGPKLTRARVKKSLEEGHPVDPLSPLKMVCDEC